MTDNYNQLKDTVSQTVQNIFNPKAIMIIIVAIIGTYLILKLLSKATNWLVRMIINSTEKSDDVERMASYKRAETWINVVFAVIKLLVIVFAIYVVWRLLNPSNAPFAVIGAGALFIVLAGATIGPMLHDITAGSMMIAERWYGVGDFVKVEPFIDVQGVVERLTLRSTKLRGLGGEVFWLRNQHIQGVKVKYRGVTTIALDVFVLDKQKAIKLLNGIIDIVPKGPMLVIDGLKISEIEQLNEKMWRIEISGQTVPGREWLIEKFAIEAILDADKQTKESQRVIVHGPIAHYVDSAAEKRFKRAIK